MRREAAPRIDGAALDGLSGQEPTRGHRLANGLAWILWALATTLLLLGFALRLGAAPAGDASAPWPSGFGALVSGLYALAITALATIGALIVARHPRHAVGWLASVGALAIGFQLVALAAVAATPADPPDRVGTRALLGWAQAWAGPASFGLGATALRLAAGSAELAVRDDGRGFDPEAVPAGHLGLSIMRERAAAVGARVEVESRPGAGTRVLVGWCEAEGQAKEG